MAEIMTHSVNSDKFFTVAPSTGECTPIHQSAEGTKGGHFYTYCTDTRDRDQNEIKWSSREIGCDQAIKKVVPR